MSAEDVAIEIITPMRAVYLSPRRMDDAEERIALQQYVAALERYDSETLRGAWALIRENHQARQWPWIGMIVKACRERRALRDQNEPAQADPHRACWEGGPMCARCKSKQRSPGFFVASAAQYRKSEDERAEIDIWFRSRTGR